MEKQKTERDHGGGAYPTPRGAAATRAKNKHRNANYDRGELALPKGMKARVQEAARTIFRALDCRGFARVDLFLTPWGEIVFNEVNTIPGFTPHSRYPAMMRAAGIPFRELVSRLIQLGAEL